MNSVRKVLSRDKLTNRLIRLFARKARAYTCAYYAFDNELLKDSAVMLGISGDDTLPHIEKLQKIFKTVGRYFSFMKWKRFVPLFPVHCYILSLEMLQHTTWARRE